MSITGLNHPDFILKQLDAAKYRFIMEGGGDFIDEYLVKFSDREDADDFVDRKRMTPVPGFARAAIMDVKNSIFQRMSDITRAGGSPDYMNAIRGKNGGVDRCDSTINHFIGKAVLPELLFMGKVGVFVDMPALPLDHTLADERDIRPYFYVYKTEQIKNWEYNDKQELTKILLEEHYLSLDDTFELPEVEVKRFRLLSMEAGKVTVRYFDAGGVQVDVNGNSTTTPDYIDLPKIPFIIFELEQPLTQDIANHQIALLNLESADISYALKANFPFYTEQQSGRVESKHLKGADDAEDGVNIDVGTIQGRQYAKGLERPDFIHPSAEPLTASMSKQEQLKNDIRMLVNLALSNVKSKFASAESKEMDSRGLESGLSAIGMILEHGERQLTAIYSAYEGANQVATIRYPERYSLKSDAQRLDEAKALGEQMVVVPSKKYQQVIGKQIVKILLDAKISTDEFDQILREIDDADFMSSDPETIHGDIERGIVSLETAAVARGYKKSEVAEAAKDHAERLARVKEAQSSDDAGARGNNDEDSNDRVSAVEEKKKSQDPDIQERGGKAIRGEGK